MSPETTPFAELGGEAVLRRLVDRFYDLMDELPEAYVIRKLHQEDLASARQKLFEYFSGWLGGPPLFEAKYGHPRMRARHMPFAIGTAERDAWLLCMAQAFDEVLPAGAARDAFWQRVVDLADFMRNREG
ncbi:group II truncated hemoglobin [Uliginosibacterium sp. 31-16]|uniref:group II truncated hemoglobin n=1 Tax=Uliginosibacterium sp. 31-16 TaxID=3068315 RepID=UPI00273F0832|nr:group II truncated hemoglobin [Uliginosibacterium sp. 31-16]MDP5239029.1 group II truncated hemoglobin [Uliginosibacterium sp. 31-16]